MPVGREECGDLKTSTPVSLAIFSQFSEIPALGVLCIRQRMLGSGAESHRHMAAVGAVSMATFQQHDINQHCHI